ETAVLNLSAAARRSGLPEPETSSTIASGLEAGKASPRDLSQIVTRPVAAARSSANGDGHPHAVDEYAALSDEDLGIIWAATIEPENVEWQQSDRLAVGKIHLLAGEGGDGKSQCAIQIIAAITGSKFHDGTSPARPGSCLILAAEDGQGDTIIPRLMA